MEIISAATDLNVPPHYFSHMSAMTKSLSPPSLEQLDNEVDMNSSPTTSYSCPILSSSVSPDRLRAPAATVSSADLASDVAVGAQQQQQQQQQQQPMTTMTSALSKVSTSTTVPDMPPSGKSVLPPLDLSSSPERQQPSPHHSVVDPQQQSMTTSELTENTDEGDGPAARDSWMQFLRHMSDFYSKSTNQPNPSDTPSSTHNRLSEQGSRSNQVGGCLTGLASTNHSSNTTTSVGNEAPLASSHQLEWFFRFQSMLNGMNQMATSHSSNLDTNISSHDVGPGTGSNTLSGLPEPFKYLFPFMAASSEQATKPTTVRPSNLFVSDDQHLKASTDQTSESTTTSNNCFGVGSQFSMQNPVFPSAPGLTASTDNFNPSSSTSLAFTASLLSMLTANHKATASSPMQPTVTSSTDNHSSLPIPTPLFSPPMSMTKLTDAPFLSSTMTTSPGMPISMGNAPSHAVSDLPTSDQLTQLNASLFGLESHKQGVPDAMGLSSGTPQQMADSRGLLYQIGQRLMAMATLSDFMSSSPYPASLGPTSLSSDRGNTSGAGSSLLGQPINSAAPTSFFNNSVEAAVAAAAAAAASAMVNQCGSNFFPCIPKSTGTVAPRHGYSTTTSSVISPSLSSPSGLSSASSASPTHAGPGTGMNLINDNKPGLEKGLMHQKAQPPHHALITSGAGLTNLSGISMRGNQKYSAYYQNQRKQGFSVAPTGSGGTITGDYFYGNRAAGLMGGTSGSRRSGFTANNPVLNSRYSNRRFRGHLSNPPPLNPHALDSKASGQRISGSRANHLALGGTAYPGFRSVGMGYKGSLSSSASPVFSSHPTVGAGTTVGGKTSTASLPKGHGPTETSLPTGQSSGPSEGTGAVTSRHKDTAFLCSCGKDFENLYVFIIHMKDTGHKPKSDNCDKDIPKLVRGQDMWINSETEQTREILRCMRCHQSFRSLPELTLHMMKTNHYSEIVYNDSGRLVFVNPDEHRRGPSNSANSTPSLSTSGKVSPGLSVPAFPSRRGWKTLNYTPTTSSNGGSALWANGPSTSLSDHCEEGRRPCDRPEVKGLHQSAGRATDSDENHCTTDKPAGKYNLSSQMADKLSGDTTPTTMSAAVSPNTKDSSLYNEIADCGSDRGSQKSPASLKSDSCTGNQNTAGTSGGETNVLRQIESFVENSLPTGSKCLSVKTDGSASSASSSLTYAPLSALTPTSEGLHSSWGKQPGSSLLPPKVERKRRYSDANSATDASHCDSPSTSPVDEAKEAKIMAKESGSGVKENQPAADNTTGAGIAAPSTTSPPSSKVTSTTSDHDTREKQKLKTQQPKSPIENPLSSLQKLVDTTANKPVAPSSAFSEMHTSFPQHIALPGTLATAKSSPLASRPQSRTSGSQLQPTRQNAGTVLDSGALRNTANMPFVNQTEMQATASASEDTEMPALSALYAYVERSSPCQSQESATNPKESVSPESGESGKLFDRPEVNLPRSLNSPLNHPSVYTGETQSTGPQSSPPSETLNMTSQLQQAAFCAAILSNLTNAQHTGNSHLPSTQGNTAAKDALPPLTIPDVAQFGREIMNTSGHGNQQRNEMVNHWWRMLQYMLGCGGSPHFPALPSMLTESDNGQLRDSDKASAGPVKSETRLSEGGATGHNPFVQSVGCSLPASSAALGLNSIHTGGTGNSIAPISVPSSQFMNSMANYRAQPPPVMSQRFTSNLMAQSLAGGSGAGLASGLVSSIITKKAKCHFCGKPFANKGQVRLHISKNKCPCLLQQSCHVAALAAAFGGDTRRPGKHGFPNSGSQSNSNNLGSSSATNRFSPSSGSQKQFQSHLLPLGSTGATAEDSLGVPSALSLLKERFQNFESTLTSGQANHQGQSHQQAQNVSTVTSPSPMTSHTINSTAVSAPGTTVPSTLNEVSLSAIASCLPQNLPNLQNMIPTSSSPAANANHLAAMALLAQTLVQLTSTNATPEATSSVSSEAAADRTAQRHRSSGDTAESQPFASFEALMPLLAASGGLDRKALFNSAQWFTHLANSSSSRSTTTKHKSTEAEEKFGQSTSTIGSTTSDLCDSQLIGGRPRSTTTPNGHL